MNKQELIYKRRWHRFIFVFLALLLCLITSNIYAQQNAPKKAAPLRASMYPYQPDGYSQVGTTQLYYKQTWESIDVMGYYNGYYYSSTFSDGGYRVAMQVNNNGAINVDCLNGTTIYGVTFEASIVQQGELARICYAVTNSNEEDVVVSLGTHADVMIGNNDHAPITRRVDTFGQTYGLTMMDGQGAKLCVLFGSGLAGVTPISDYWFGYYYLNSDAYQMVGNYSSGDSYMVENGSYDSGMGWCWKDRTITAGSTVVFSYVIGVGEVNLEPNSSFEVTPDDPEGWNDLSRPHRLSLNGSYESPAGLEGVIDYAVEDSEDWIALTDTLASGDEFTASLVAMFDATKPTHVIKFRTRDLVGNTTMLHPIEYVDVSFHALTGIEDKTYTGDSLFQSGLTCDLNEEQYSLIYHNNINAGTASFNLEGVFPYTIGRKTYTFTINPQPLSGFLSLTNTEFVYSGENFTPEWQFTNGAYTNLEEGKDYEIAWSDNKLPGTGSLIVSGKNNYTGSLTATFNIDKAQLVENLYSIVLPEEDVTYDGLAHRASFSSVAGVGIATFTYTYHGEINTLENAPIEEGIYDVYMEIAEGELYYGKPKEYIASFTIHHLDETEWLLLSTLYTELTQMGGTIDWNISDGAKAVSSFDGVSVEQGHIVGIDLSGKNLTGTIPMSIASFPNIKSIDLSSNQLSGDIPTIIGAIKAQNPQAFANLKKLNINNNSYMGNVGVLAYCLPALTALDVSYNKFEDVYPMISSHVTELNTSCQQIDRVVDLNMSDLSVEDLATKVPSILLYDHENQTFRMGINLLCTSADLTTFDKIITDEWALQLSITGDQITIPYVSTQNAYYGESGDTLNVLNMNMDNTIEGSSFKIALFFEQGDANFVNGVDATDLQATILYAFGGYKNLPFNHTAADTYKDLNINVQDVVCTVNILLESAPATMSRSVLLAKSRALKDGVDETDSYVYIKGNQIFLRSNTPIASLSIKTIGNINWDVEKYGMKQSVRHGNMVSYSLNGMTLPANEDIIIGESYDNVTIYAVSMSDIEANPIKVSVLNDVPTYIDSIEVCNNNAEVYGVSGVKRNAMTKGVNIIKQNGKTIKFLKK